MTPDEQRKTRLAWPPWIQRESWLEEGRNHDYRGLPRERGQEIAFENGRRMNSVYKASIDPGSWDKCERCGTNIIWRNYDGDGAKPIDRQANIHACP